MQTCMASLDTPRDRCRCSPGRPVCWLIPTKLCEHSTLCAVPTLPSDRNPNAATILSQAAQQAAKREARLAAKPTLAKGGGGGSRKRKTKVGPHM